MITNDSNSRDERGPEFSIFVGDLGPEVTEFVLVQLFLAVPLAFRFENCDPTSITIARDLCETVTNYGLIAFEGLAASLLSTS